MKTKTKLGLAAASALLVQTSTANVIVLAGIHGFTDQTAKSPTESANVQAAQEGVLAATSGISYKTLSTATGGSTDNWYGPDSAARGGIMTEQLPFDPTAFSGANPDGTTDRITVGGFSANGPNGLTYDPEMSGANPRLVTTYDDVDTALPVPQPTVDDGMGNLVASTANGRIADINSSDFAVFNDTQTTFQLGDFMFDSFVGQASSNADSVGVFEAFTLQLDVGNISETITVDRSYAGYNNQRGDALDDPLAPAATVDNLIDYGFGTNYLDFVISLRAYELQPGEELRIGLNSSSQSGAVLRGDNFVLTAVPEPSSALVLGGLLGLSLLGSRRRK